MAVPKGPAPARPRQTAALESIRSMLAFLTILTVVGVVLGAVAAFGV
jgi:hypothetical protein